MYYVGIDLGGTNIACGLVDVTGTLLTKKSCKTMANRPAEEIMADMATTEPMVISIRVPSPPVEGSSTPRLFSTVAL